MSRTISIGRGRSGQLTARIFAVALAGSMLGGCYPAAYTVKETVSYPNDYRKRHQIGLRDGSRTVEVFIGQSRGSLTPTQRAEVLAFAKVWKDEATGGVVIDVPTGTPNQIAASQALREINSIFSASGSADAECRGPLLYT